MIGYDGADHVVYRDGEVVYADDRVELVGHGYPGPVDRVVQAGDAIVSPGFVHLNALAEIDHGILDTWPGPDLMLGHQWSEDYFTNRRHELFSPDAYSERDYLRRPTDDLFPPSFRTVDP